MIPKSKPSENFEWNFRIQKVSQRATILALLFGHFPGVLKNDAGYTKLLIRCSKLNGRVFWGYFRCSVPFSAFFSAVSSRIIVENRTFLIFQIWQMSNNITQGKILERGNTVRMTMLNRGTLVQSKYDTALKNITNLRGQVDPEEDRSSQNSQSNGHTILAVPPYQLIQEPMILPSVSYSVLF